MAGRYVAERCPWAGEPELRVETAGALVDRREQPAHQDRGLVAGQRVLREERAVGEAGVDTAGGEVADGLGAPIAGPRLTLDDHRRERDDQQQRHDGNGRQ